jgi:hypothetical protein
MEFSTRQRRHQARVERDRFCSVAAAVVGGAVVSSVVGASAASSAANTQAAAGTAAANASLQATQETNALNWDIYQQNLTNVSPQLQISQEADAALASGLGLGVPNTGINQTALTSGSGGYGGNLTGTGLTAAPGVVNPSQAANGPQARMGVATPLTGVQVQPGGTAGGSPGQMVAAPPGAPTSAPGTTPVGGVPGVGTPGITNFGANQTQLNAAGSSQAPGSLLANFGQSQLQGYLPSGVMGFVQAQGEQALLAHDNALGIGQSGQEAKDATNFAENTAGTFYQQAFSNYLTTQQQNINALSSLAGNGAVGQANAAGTSAGNAITSNTQAGINSYNNYQTGSAAASAAGNVGVANAVSGAIGNATSGYLTSQIINKYLQTPTPAPAGQ